MKINLQLSISSVAQSTEKDKNFFVYTKSTLFKSNGKKEDNAYIPPLPIFCLPQKYYKETKKVQSSHLREEFAS